MQAEFRKAPELVVAKWLNTETDLSLAHLRGKVVVIFAFQMLCPGCIEYSIPQAKKVYELFPENDVAVLGLHTVFEHHDAMSEVSLRAYLHEYKVRFPVAIDAPSSQVSDPFPQTMRTYKTAGTPTLILLDRNGFLRKQKMGHELDLVLGADIMALMMEPEISDVTASRPHHVALS